MKVILAHKFLHLVGGTEIYFQNLADILSQHGHETIPFAVEDERNPPSEYSRYFLKPLDFRHSSLRYNTQQFFRILSRTLYSFEARRKVRALIQDLQPDIAHLQVIENHMSPSIIDEIRRHDLPIVQSVNTYKHVCASSRLYLLDRQEICYQCQGGAHYHAALNRCVKDSLMASVLAMLEMYLHESLLRTYHQVDRFIVPNAFIEEKMLEAGYAAEKIVRLRNPFELSKTAPNFRSDNYILYFGRVEPEKGVLDVVKAMVHLSHTRLVVVGDGSQLQYCRDWADRNDLKNIEFVGPKWGDELAPYLENCRAVVVPSLWYEPSPYVIYQALSAGKPVVANRVGGIPDLITETTGRLSSPGNIEELAGHLAELCSDASLAEEMGRNARTWAEDHLSPEVYYRNIMAVYDAARG